MNNLLLYSALFLQEPSPSGLQGLYEPESVQFALETPGWYILGGLILVLAGAIFYRFYRRDQYRREAMGQIKELGRGDPKVASQILILLKNVAIAVYGRDRVASLKGEQWLSFLDSSSGKTQFMTLSESIAREVYTRRSMEQDQYESLYTNAVKWIRTHERKF